MDRGDAMDGTDGIEGRIAKARENPEAMSVLINEYSPFIARVVKNHIGHYVTAGVDDEFSIGMSGFEEALRTYIPEKGYFLSFAEKIIRWRLIDYYRKNARWTLNASLEQLQEENGSALVLGARAQQAYQQSVETDQMTAEILEFREALSEWGIDFSQLLSLSPKQEKIRRLLQETARKISADPMLLQKLKATGKVPVQQILSMGWIDRKRMERGRVYIIACVIVLTGEYEMIHDYLEWR